MQTGLYPRRLAALTRDAVVRCRLDLSGLVVLTEAASGPYVVTPVMAALAGAARVYALTRATSYGTVAEVADQTFDLAGLLGVGDRIEVITQKSRAVVSQADIITNSGHVRPVDAEMISWMKSDAVVPLMYEIWEFRPGDVDLDACRACGIATAGTNERHPAVDVFSFLGVLAIRLLLDAGVAVYQSHVLVLCDNVFDVYIERGLVGAGARVDTFARLSDACDTDYDVVLVAMRPQQAPVLDDADAQLISTRMPGAIVAQFWGDVDRPALQAAGVPVWPVESPAAGHMGILLSAIGPEAVVRLQAGGLKVGEVLARRRDVLHPDLAFVQVAAEEREYGGSGMLAKPGLPSTYLKNVVGAAALPAALGQRDAITMSRG
jgi:hypothetical protein